MKDFAEITFQLFQGAKEDAITILAAKKEMNIHFNNIFLRLLDPIQSTAWENKIKNLHGFKVPSRLSSRPSTLLEGEWEGRREGGRKEFSEIS